MTEWIENEAWKRVKKDDAHHRTYHNFALVLCPSYLLPSCAALWTRAHGVPNRKWGGRKSEMGAEGAEGRREINAAPHRAKFQSGWLDAGRPVAESALELQRGRGSLRRGRISSKAPASKCRGRSCTAMRRGCSRAANRRHSLVTRYSAFRSSPFCASLERPLVVELLVPPRYRRRLWPLVFCAATWTRFRPPARWVRSPAQLRLEQMSEKFKPACKDND